MERGKGTRRFLPGPTLRRAGAVRAEEVYHRGDLAERAVAALRAAVRAAPTTVPVVVLPPGPAVDESIQFLVDHAACGPIWVLLRSTWIDLFQRRGLPALNELADLRRAAGERCVQLEEHAMDGVACAQRIGTNAETHAAEAAARATAWVAAVPFLATRCVVLLAASPPHPAAAPPHGASPTAFPTVGTRALVSEYPPWAADAALQARAHLLLLQRSSPAAPPGHRGHRYDIHWSQRNIEAALRKGRVLIGEFRVVWGGRHGRRWQLAVVAPDAGGGNQVTAPLRGGTSTAEEPPRAVLVSGLPDANRACHGDRVAVLSLDEDAWIDAATLGALASAAPTGDPADPAGVGAGDGARPPRDPAGAPLADEGLGGEDAALAPRFALERLRREGIPAAGAVPCGRVIAIVRRAWRPFVCTLSAQEEARLATAGPARRRPVVVVPAAWQLPPLRVHAHAPSRLARQRLLAEPYAWPRDSRFPLARIVAALGPRGRREAEVAALLAEAGLLGHARPFSEAAVGELPRPPPSPGGPDGLAHWLAHQRAPIKRRGAPGAGSAHDGGQPPGPGPPVGATWWAPGVECAASRWDIRHSRLVFSVDPVGCEDIDDAMSVLALGDGLYEVGVHIADVTHFVRGGGPLDAEALRRATSVYLADRRLDMLPRLLSADLCSLRARRDRLAVSAVWHVDAARGWARVPGTTWVGRTLLRSLHSLAYEQADALLRGDGGTLPTASAERERRWDQGLEWVATGDPLPAARVGALADSLRVLASSAHALRARRAAAGSLALASAEVDFALDDAADAATASAGGDRDAPLPVGAHAHAELDVHRVVADLMIAANETVARVLTATLPAAAMVRAHEPPDAHGLAAVAETARAAGVPQPPPLAGGGDDPDPARIGEWLAALTAPAAATDGAAAPVEIHPAVLRSLLHAVVRALRPARYLAAGEAGAAAGSMAGAMWLEPSAERQGGAWVRGDEERAGPPGLSHYGLGLAFYTHFTSPIRRYADIVVHRQLLTAIAGCATAAAAARPGSTSAGRRALGHLPSSATPSAAESAAALRHLARTGHTGSDAAAAGSARDRAAPGSQNEAGLPLVPGRVPIAGLSAWEVPERVAAVARHTHEQSRRAQRASEAARDLFLALFVAHRPLLVEATLDSVRGGRVRAYVPGLGVRCVLDLGWDGYVEPVPKVQSRGRADGAVLVPAWCVAAAFGTAPGTGPAACSAEVAQSGSDASSFALTMHTPAGAWKAGRMDVVLAVLHRPPGVPAGSDSTTYRASLVAPTRTGATATAALALWRRTGEAEAGAARTFADSSGGSDCTGEGGGPTRADVYCSRDSPKPSPPRALVAPSGGGGGGGGPAPSLYAACLGWLWSSKALGRRAMEASSEIAARAGGHKAACGVAGRARQATPPPLGPERAPRGGAANVRTRVDGRFAFGGWRSASEQRGPVQLSSLVGPAPAEGMSREESALREHDAMHRAHKLGARKAASRRAGKR